MQTNPRLSAIIDHLSRQPKRYKSVRLAVGELVAFPDDLIHAQWDSSAFAQTALIVRRIPAEHQCMACFGLYYPTRTEVSCPFCGGVGAKVLAGEEFFLEFAEEME